MIASRRTEWILLGLGGGILVLTLAALSLHVPGSIWVGTVPRKDAVVALMLASGALYAGAVALVVRLPAMPRLLAPVLAIAVALRVALLLAPPFMSSDIYRYVWDGRVQAAGINPYVHVPADAALIGLRDATIFPRINRADYAHTIYPPAAQMIFAAIGRVSDSVLATKFCMLLLEACGILAALRLLALAKMPPARVLIYAWNPLVLWAVAGDGHIDGAMIGLLGLAMWAAVRQRSGLAGALLGGAILTKFLPIAVLPALWRRWDWKLPTACAAMIIALYACYAGAGWQVLGFLPNYTHEEGFSGSGFWLLAALGQFAKLPPWAGAAYVLAAACILACVAAAMVFGAQPRTDSDRVRLIGDRVAVLAAATTAAMSAHYPWYFSWLALPGCFSVRPSVLWLSVAPMLLYGDPWHDEILLQTAVFAPAIALAAFEAWRRLPHHLAMPAERNA
jgi:alpha-1,6-mannosyltransferase